ncbi:MAG: phosphate signaling complex protein PhoU [Deltaproteobacteria bacterium]|nr:phosphate signaling complex protein PhoU [Deltaproteobacteria bacterium]
MPDRVHIRVERDLDSLRGRAVKMAGLCEAILAKSLRAVRERDPALAAEVKHDDLAIDQLDIEIDDLVLQILALDAPVASDLRHVIAIKSIATDLERIGDIARNIAGCARRLSQHPPVQLGDELAILEESSRTALGSAIRAFRELDVELARAVLGSDDKIDELEGRIIRGAISRLSGSPEHTEQEIDLIFITKDLERVGDHATNIAEEVILAAEAKNLKHAAKLAAQPR